ncbi:hypothetical protein TWF694_004603 [Orbilia ellipsospora]|uniref:BTB domain-containing protein n=1 Tax=Orbilia ellipsospora TaxID=2528407 RepID=A0AAV9WVZ0_9PEZI
MNSPSPEIILLIGKAKTPFKVIRETLAAESNYFANYCDKLSNEENPTITLPNISDDAFAVIVEWLYLRKYILPKKVDHEQFCGIYKCAVETQMESLKAVMLEKLGERIMKEEDFDNTDDFTVPEAFDLFYMIAGLSTISDWGILRKLVDKILPSWTRADGELIRLATSEENHNLATALVLDCLQETMWANACSDCRWKFQRETTKKCRCCGGSLEYQKREGPP